MRRIRWTKTSAATWDGDWPFTVDHGRLGLDRGLAVIFEHDGTRYALNGHAMALGYERVEPIWKITRVITGGQELRVPLDTMIAAGLAL